MAYDMALNDGAHFSAQGNRERTMTGNAQDRTRDEEVKSASHGPMPAGMNMPK